MIDAAIAIILSTKLGITLGLTYRVNSFYYPLVQPLKLVFYKVFIGASDPRSL